MTNVEGLWVLFVALFLFAVSVVVTTVLVGVLGWDRWTDGHTRRLARLRTVLAILGLVVSSIAWVFALVLDLSRIVQ